jgi:hypothetical protein
LDALVGRTRGQQTPFSDSLPLISPHRSSTPMNELFKITEKYDADFVKDGLSSLESINGFALNFYKDVAEI